MPSNGERALEFLRALESLDAASIIPMLTEDVVEVLPLAASGGTRPALVAEGRDAVANIQRVIVESFSVVEFAEPQVTESNDGQTVFVESFGRRRQRETERVYENIYVLKFEFRDGLIHRITEYSNPVAFAKFFDQDIG